jgi:hypothetical protein
VGDKPEDFGVSAIPVAELVEVELAEGQSNALACAYRQNQ